MKIHSDAADSSPLGRSKPQGVRKLILTFCGGLFFLLAMLLFIEHLNSRHPHLGRIYHTSAHDLNVARGNKLASFLSDNVPRSVLQSRYYPDRLKNQPKYLQLGDHQMEWSIGGPHTGWLYFWNVDGMPRTYPWELAQTSETNFAAIQPSSIPAHFLNPTNLPSTASSTNAISCSAGSIIFARRNDETNKIYILYLAHQQDMKLSVQYCVVQHPRRDPPRSRSL